MVKIYTLADPINGSVRYVGKTNGALISRLTGHIKDSKRRNHKTAKWIGGLDKKGLKPSIELIDEVDIENWKEEERFYISYFNFLGFKLLNMAEGGEGGDGSFMKKNPYYHINRLRNNPDLYAKSKDSFRKTVTGRVRSDEFVNKVRSSQKGRMLSKERSDLIKIQHIQSGIKSRKIVVKYDSNKNKLEEFGWVIDAARSVGSSRGAILWAIRNKKIHKDCYWDYLKGLKKHRISVIQYNENGFSKEYPSVIDAINKSNVGKSSIWRSLRWNKKVKGFYFKYKN